MAKVIDITERLLENTEHLSGDALCIECGHKWTAVVPVGTEEFECPSCHTHKGVMDYGVLPEVYWECACGCSMFVISGVSNRVLCFKCGAEQEAVEENEG